ncbi:phosphonate ABC transporter ATP-binding protein [Dolichospermum compactum]|uniref:Phosphonate ABC transport ATP-binding component n=1 Tax=Dolichospermum compactum NIES-806 TaxID=1973481 RepID=A0A1Z4V9L0_9CYAN|nr:ATP-binding cassette domain-containing protein [Dolichospermum compactum]BAZ87999.1 phosphonate ABC transport ATP-binding component [Dolichospermum compactum NIES-806]
MILKSEVITNYHLSKSNVNFIECCHLRTDYIASLKRPILNNINCQINQGEFVVLLGLNGAGKSTLLKSLVGLVPLIKGEIKINGVSVGEQNLPQIRRDVGMLFQGGGLIRQLSAIDNVLCGRLGVRKTRQTLFGFGQRDRTLALELLTQLGLKEQAYQKTSKLSGGQQQKVAIARALMQSPQILLADEPTTGLDVVASQQVMATLSELHQQGLTIITVLHDLALATEYAQRAIILDGGKVVYDGKCENLQEQFS